MDQQEMPLTRPVRITVRDEAPPARPDRPDPGRSGFGHPGFGRGLLNGIIISVPIWTAFGALVWYLI